MRYVVTQVVKRNNGTKDMFETECASREQAISCYERILWNIHNGNEIGNETALLVTLNEGCTVERGAYFNC